MEPMTTLRKALLRIDLKFLPHESKVIGGRAKVIVNANDPETTRIFSIPPQTALGDIGSFGVWRESKGFTLITTNWR
jgi:hypothetical protein